MWYKDKKWWAKALERAIRSLAQGILVGIGECVVIQQVNWVMALSTGGLMFIVSLLTSIACGLPEYNGGLDDE
jgi:hypothetical protein